MNTVNTTKANVEAAVAAEKQNAIDNAAAAEADAAASINEMNKASKSGFAAFKDEMGEKIHGLTSKAKEMTAESGEKLAGTGSQLKDKVKKVAADALEAGSNAASKLADSAHNASQKLAHAG